MSEVDKVTDKTVTEGGVLALLYFDVHGNNKEGIQQLGVDFIQRIVKEPGVVYAKGQIDEPIKEEKLFSTSIEVKILAKTFIDLMRICGNYSPFSVDVLKPGEVKLSIDKVHDLLMYVSTTTHEYKKFIFQKTSSDEDRLRYLKNIQQRMKLGKILMDKKKK